MLACCCGHSVQVAFFLRDEFSQAYARHRGSAVGVLVRWRRTRLIECPHVVEVEPKHSINLLLLKTQIPWRCGVEHEEDFVELPVAPARYILLYLASPEGDEPLGRYPQAELLFDLPQAVQSRFPCREVPCSGNVQVVRPGIFRGGTSLEEQIGPFGIGTIDPTVKTPVPQAQTVRLTLRNDLSRRPPRLVHDIKQLIHTEKSSISASQHGCAALSARACGHQG